MPLSTQITIGGKASLTKTHDLVAATPADHPINATISMTSGTGAGLADLVWADTRSTGATDSLDLAGGGLVDYYGTALAFAKLKAIFVTAASGNAADLRLTRPATNGVPWLLAAGDAVVLPPGATFLWVAPSAGVTVTAGTGDLVDVVAASGTLTYNITLIGTSA